MHVRKRYYEKIEPVEIDPFLLSEKDFDSECFPPVESIDVASFLVLKRATIRRTNLKPSKVCTLIIKWYLDLSKLCKDGL